MRVPHIELYQLEVTSLPRMLTVGSLVLNKKRAASKLRIWLIARGTFPMPSQAADHAPGAHVVLRVLKLVMVDTGLESKQARAES